jgi:hypothetical protein
MQLEADLRSEIPAEELPAAVDAEGLALWAHTLRLGLSSLENDGMSSAETAAVVEIAIRCLDGTTRRPPRPRQPMDAIMLLAAETPGLHYASREQTVFGGEYAS